MARILFLCTGNSCRSQMAEGWTRHLAGQQHTVASAGIEAHGLNPRAVTVMSEAGVDITSQTSDTLERFDLERFDVLITVCGDADERCPLVPSGVRKIHWPLDDPARLTGTENEVMDGFRKSRDEVRDRVSELLRILSTGE